MKPPRILIVTAHHLCRNPRALKEAQALGSAGYDVTVLGVSAHPIHEVTDQALAAGQPFRRATLDNLGRTPAARPAAILRRARVWLARQINRHTPFRTLSALGPAHALLRLARRHPAELTIVHTEMPAWVGVQLLRTGRRVAADIEDWHSEDLLPEARRFLPLTLLRGVEQTLLRDAVYTSTTSEPLAAALHLEYGGRRPHAIHNVFPLPPPPPPRGVDRPVRFVWFSQTVGPGRGLEQFFDAWARLTLPTEVRLIGEVTSEYQERLIAPLAPEQRRRVSFTGWIPASELPTHLADCDIGLALEPRAPRNKDLTISNKILQYLGGGLAVVASDTAGQRELMSHAAGAGVLVDPAKIEMFAGELTALAGDRPRLSVVQHAARAAAERQYCWEHESKRLLALVESAVSPSR